MEFRLSHAVKHQAHRPSFDNQFVSDEKGKKKRQEKRRKS